MTASEDVLALSVDGPVAVLVVNRPGRLNALNRQVCEGLVRTLEQLDRDPAVHVLVLTGAGDKSFIAGAVRALAAVIAAKSPVALRLIKEAVRASVRTPLDQGLRLESALFGLAFSTEDRVEGISAFLAKRDAKFVGR